MNMVSHEDPSEVQSWVREKLLGAGGFGTVTLWRHKNTDRLIAVKKCRFGTDNLLTPKQKERWKKEVEIMMRLNHPNVVTVFPVPEEIAQLHSDLPMLCMEYCNKGDLRQVLNRAENNCGLREADVRELVKDIISAIKYLHSQRITHRDLKPENIVLATQDSGSVLYKLIDLGYAKELDQTSICTSFVGTLQYLAPELFTTESVVPSGNRVPEQVERRYTSSVDYWSLGLVTHEAITGVRPFLPNMAPGTWMKHVMKKSPDHICAYQTSTGVIEFSAHLFRQNHISSALRVEMEQWLKLALEWDSKKRGRNRKTNEIIIFSSMEKILEKKIIKVFSGTMYEWFSYVYDLQTPVNQLQEWIEKDTSLLVKDQELFMAGRKPIDYSGVLAQSVSGDEDVMFVLHRSKFELPSVIPNLPPMVVDILQSPRDQLEYNYQKRTYANAVFFLNQENSLYKQFLVAFKLKLLSVVQRCQRMVRTSQQLAEKLTATAAQKDLSSKAYKFDTSQMRDTPRLSSVSLDLSDTWKTQIESTDRKWNTLRSSCAQLTTQTQAANKRVHEVQVSPLSANKEDPTLRKLEDEGLRLIESLRRRSTAEKSKSKDSLEMVKVIYACLKQRDIVLRNKDMATHFRNMIEADAEVQRISPLVETALERVTALRAEIEENFQNRQRTVWQLIHASDQLPYSVHLDPKSLSPSLCPSESLGSLQNLKHSQSAQSLAQSEPRNSPILRLASSQTSVSSLHAKPTFSLGSQEPITRSYCTSGVDSGIAGSVNCSMPKSHNGLSDEELTVSMIDENKSLRMTTQELMMQSYNQCLKLINDDKSMDWSFLKQ